MGKLGSQVVKHQLKALVASDPENNTPLMKHCEGLTKHSDKLRFALPLKLDRAGNFITDAETQSIASLEILALRMVGWRVPWWPTILVC